MTPIIGLYVLPLASLGLIGWAASTGAPPPVLVAFVALLGWPALTFARRQGWMEGAREARDALRSGLDLDAPAARPERTNG